MKDIFQTGITHLKCGLKNTEYDLMPFQDMVEYPVTIICLDPVKEGE
jgi:hypothetical protein